MLPRLLGIPLSNLRLSVALTYFDNETGRNRIKRRYVWGAWGYALGALTILMLHMMIY